MKYDNRYLFKLLTLNTLESIKSGLNLFIRPRLDPVFPYPRVENYLYKIAPRNINSIVFYDLKIYLNKNESTKCINAHISNRLHQIVFFLCLL